MRERIKTIWTEVDWWPKDREYHNESQGIMTTKKPRSPPPISFYKDYYANNRV